MRYLGGKSRNAKAISSILIQHRNPLEPETYFEPFCGGLSVALKMEGPMILNDLHEGLITLYRSIQDGTFKYPTKALTVEDYKWYRTNGSIEDPMYTAVGFGLSYAGKWWGGYDSYYDTRDRQGESTQQLVNSLKKKFSNQGIQSAKFENKSYLDFNPKNQIIYCDPPYENTTGYKGVDGFDHKLFWETMRKWSKDNTVFISEFNAPNDFKEIWSAKYKVQMCVEQQQVIEKLFTFKG